MSILCIISLKFWQKIEGRQVHFHFRGVLFKILAYLVGFIFTIFSTCTWTLKMYRFFWLDLALKSAKLFFQISWKPSIWQQGGHHHGGGPWHWSERHHQVQVVEERGREVLLYRWLIKNWIHSTPQQKGVWLRTGSKRISAVAEGWIWTSEDGCTGGGSGT